MAKKQELETTLYHLPRPNRKHVEALDNLLHRVVHDVGFHPDELRLRDNITQKVDKLLRLSIPGSYVRSYGSSMTNIGLRLASGLNLDLQIPPEVPPHEALIKAYQSLCIHSADFTDIFPEFMAKIPFVSFNAGGIRCELSLNNNLAFQTSALIRDYVGLDPRVKTLLVALRFWAHICKLDRQAEGTLPPHAFALLMIHFLQRHRKPVLPCIHDYIKNDESDTYTSK